MVHHLNVLLPTHGVFDTVGPFNFSAGVDLFFAISGYVITQSLSPQLNAASTATAKRRVVFAFWIKRAFRLWPSAWFWLGFILLTTGIFKFSNPQLGFQTNVSWAIAGGLNFANFRFALAFGHAPLGASFHYWSLSLEEQFYLLLPLVVMLFGRRASALLAVLMVIDVLRPPSFLTVSTRIASLILGVLIARWSRHASYAWVERRFARLSRGLAFALCLGAALLIALAGGRSGAAPLKWGLVAAAAGATVLLASFDRDALSIGRHWRSFAEWVGRRSYALYLIHLPIYLVLNDILRGYFVTPPIPFFKSVVVCLAMLSVAALAELNYRVIETPFRDRGRRLAERLNSARKDATANTGEINLAGRPSAR